MNRIKKFLAFKLCLPIEKVDEFKDAMVDLGVPRNNIEKLHQGAVVVNVDTFTGDIVNTETGDIMDVLNPEDVLNGPKN